MQEGIHVNLSFPLVVQPRILISTERPRIGHSTLVRQKLGSPSRQEGPRQSVGVHHANSRAHTKVWESMVKVSQKNVKRGGNG